MKRLVLVLVAAVCLAAPASALAGGVVLKVDRASHLVAVTSGKHVVLVHTAAAGRLHVGQRVRMQSRRLRNGTLAASRVHVVGRAHSVTFRGLVLSRSRSAQRMTLSAGGAPVSVHSATTAPPGSEVEVDADVSNSGALDASHLDVVAPTAAGGSIEGHIFALAPGSITIVSDNQMLMITVPSGIDVSGLQVGDEVLANFSQGSDGTLTLTGISADESAQAADEQNGDDNQQGDDNGGSSAGGQSGDDGDQGATAGSGSSGDDGQSAGSGSGGGDQSGSDDGGDNGGSSGSDD